MIHLAHVVFSIRIWRSLHIPATSLSLYKVKGGEGAVGLTYMAFLFSFSFFFFFFFFYLPPFLLFTTTKKREKKQKN